MKYKVLVKTIIENIGGRGNIKSVNHCMTRLRFQLNDYTEVNTENLKRTNGIVTALETNGQYQVVIGTHVSDVYNELLTIAKLNTNDTTEDLEADNKNAFSKLLDVITAVFIPIMMVLPAAGMIKGLSILLGSLGIISKSSGVFKILMATGDSVMYYFPILLGCTAARKFKLNEFIGMAIGGAMVHPTITKLATNKELYNVFEGSFLESPVKTTFFEIPVILMPYAGKVIPIILAVYFASKVEKFYKRLLPDLIKKFLTPSLTLLTVTPLTFIVIGPVATILSNTLGLLVTTIHGFSPIIAGIVMGTLWQVFVMFGLHWVLISIAITNISTLGFDSMMFMGASTPWATAGVVLAIFLKTKDKDLKAIAFPAFLSSLFGISEPSLYGITLPRKIPFYITLFSGSIGGIIMALFQTKRYNLAGPGMIGLAGYINPETGVDYGFYGFVLASIVGLSVGFILTYVWGYEKSEQLLKKKSEANKVELEGEVLEREVLLSPIKGELRSLAEIDDSIFSKEIIGKGIAINPIEGKVVAPANGVVKALFHDKHAISILTDNGAEVLIHIGINNTEIEPGKFITKIKEGERITKGQLLLEFNVVKDSLSNLVAIIVTNYDKYKEIKKEDKKNIDYQDNILTTIV